MPIYIYISYVYNKLYRTQDGLSAYSYPYHDPIRYPGEEGGTALANVLFGMANPSGRLPITIVQSTDQLPDYLDLHMARFPGRTHRYLTLPPIYPFGFGLSYTRLRYENLQLSPNILRATDTLSVAVDIAHLQGPLAVEVVQVYVSLLDPPSGSNVSIPLQDLRNFTRITVAPGGVTSAHFAIPATSLALVGYDGRLSVLPGRYRVFVGGVSPNWRTPFTVDQPVADPLVGEIVVEG